MYMEGCTAPQFETSTLHSAVVELVALKGAKIQYVTVQNWSSNVVGFMKCVVNRTAIRAFSSLSGLFK